MDEFIEKIILGKTIQAAFQRGEVYAEGIPRKSRIALHKSIKEELKRMASNYYNNFVSEDDHIKNIEQLSDTITERHGDILKCHKLRIGTAQKLLNVYIKFLWCLGEINRPHHCPVDRIVLKKIKDDRKWTDLKTIENYKDIISKIRDYVVSIEEESIAEWEYKLWNKEA